MAYSTARLPYVALGLASVTAAQGLLGPVISLIVAFPKSLEPSFSSLILGHVGLDFENGRDLITSVVPEEPTEFTAIVLMLAIGEGVHDSLAVTDNNRALLRETRLP